MTDLQTKPPHLDNMESQLSSKHLPQGPPPLSKIVESLKKTISKNFWGEVTIKFKDGKPVLITTVSQTKIH